MGPEKAHSENVATKIETKFFNMVWNVFILNNFRQIMYIKDNSFQSSIPIDQD